MEAKLHILDEEDIFSELIHSPDIFERLPDVGLLLEPPLGTIVAANRAVRDTLGYDSTTLVGRSVESIAFPESRERQSDVWLALNSGDQVKDVDVDLAGRNGRRIETSVSSAFVRNVRGKAVVRVAIFRDISRRRRREREILQL